MTESVSSDFVRQVRLALEVLAGQTSLSPTDELSALVGGGGGEFLIVREEQAANGQSGGFTSGSFQTRTLNTVVVNSITGASLAANRITLPEGTFNVFARAPAFSVDRHKARLRDLNIGQDLLVGSSEICVGADNVGNNSWVIGQFTLGEAGDVELQHRCQTTIAVNGFGVESNFGVIEVYSEVWLEKVA